MGRKTKIYTVGPEFPIIEDTAPPVSSIVELKEIKHDPFKKITTTTFRIGGDNTNFSKYAGVALLCYGIAWWFIYASPLFSGISRLFPYLSINFSTLIYINLVLMDEYQEKMLWEYRMSFLHMTTLWATILVLTDLLFDVYWIPMLIFGVNDIFTIVTIDLCVILSIIAIDSLVTLIVAEKRQGVKISIKYTLPATMLVVSIAGLLVLIISRIRIEDDIINLAALLPSNVNFSEIVYQALIPTLPEGQYGSGDAFTQVFEMLFYNPTTMIMLAIMVIGNIANILVINQTKSAGIQSMTTISVVGTPMIIIVSIFIGVIEPPTIFVNLFGSAALGSFVFGFAEMSVYIIFASIILAFSQMAELFQPQDED